MMLRSLVKKFKSHSLNEDGPPSDGQQSPSESPTSESQATNELNSPPDIVRPTPLVSSTAAKEDTNAGYEVARQHYHATGANVTVANPMAPRHHHLRSSGGCGCNSTTVSSIATRLRSSMMAAANTVPAMHEQQQRQYVHHRPCNMCAHRRSGPRHTYGQGSASKTGDANNANLDDESYKDSGTESDDEELEQIETNSTHSVPVSQTSDYYASQQSLSINSCRSSHCSSPLLGLSDQECNSWESVGSESGISVRTARQHCQHQKHHNNICRSSNPNSCTAGINASFQLGKFDNPMLAAMRPPSEMLMTEELPQHHYHTRQQFQRLTQQISMKNGLISTSSNCDFAKTDDADDDRGFTPTGFVSPTQQPTAFVPVRRATTAPQSIPITVVDQSQEGGGGSSLDELEELNFGQHQNQKTRRARAATVSVTPTNAGNAAASSEKRKWSQMRHEQKRQSLEDGEKKRQDRPILHAARKTPIKLLYSLDGGGEQKMTTSRCQLPQQQGNVSPSTGSQVKKLRSTKSKTCRGGCEEFESDEKGGVFDPHRCPKDEDEDDEEMGRAAKRPSLDFNKMRGKLVGIFASGNRNKKTKRSSSLVNSGTKSKLKTLGSRREGYQLRSTHRQCCLFRPLEPPVALPTSNGGISDQQSAWFPHQQHHSGFQPWQQQTLNGTFYFGANTSGQ